MIRVCHIMTADLWAGAEVQLATTASYLAGRADVSVTAVLFHDGRLADELRQLGIDVTVVDESRHSASAILMFLTRHLRNRRIDVVHTHRYKDTVLGTIAARLAGVPHVVRTVHGLREPLSGWNHWKFRAYEALDKAVLHLGADRVIAVSNRTADALRYSGYRPPLVTTIHNGIDLGQVIATRSRQDLRREWGFDDTAVVIGTVGRLSPVKGQDGFLRAVKVILEREPAARFVIAGDGPLEDELMALASRLQIAHACRFLGARSDVYDVISALDVFALPSLNEGLPMAILEATALGVPVVATHVGGMPEIIRHRETGLLVWPGDDRALADACLELVRDREFASTLAARARQVVEAEFSRDRNGEALVDIYRTARLPRHRRVGALDLCLGFSRRLLEYGARSLRHAVERRQVNRIRRSPAALVSALKAGKNILVVCHGNIIRSPFAAFLLAQSLGERAAVSIASAGLEAMPGRPPHPTALRMAAARCLDLSSHAASRVEREAVAKSDVIFVMDIPQLLVVRQRFPEARAKTFLLSSLAPETPLEIRDPVDGDESVFQACFDHITRAIRPVAGVLTQSPQRT